MGGVIYFSICNLAHILSVEGHKLQVSAASERSGSVLSKAWRGRFSALRRKKTVIENAYK